MPYNTLVSLRCHNYLRKMACIIYMVSKTTKDTIGYQEGDQTLESGKRNTSRDLY
jgi:hypothetical protein